MVSTKRKFELDFVSDFELTTEFDIRFAKISGYFNTKYWYLDITEIGMKTPLELAWKFPLNLVKLILISPKYWDLNGRTASSPPLPPLPEIGIPKLVKIEHFNSNGIDFSFELITRKTNQSKLRFISLMKLS